MNLNRQPTLRNGAFLRRQNSGRPTRTSDGRTRTAFRARRTGKTGGRNGRESAHRGLRTVLRDNIGSYPAGARDKAGARSPLRGDARPLDGSARRVARPSGLFPSDGNPTG